MTDVARPSPGEARVCAAVALGWQMAKLYHSPVPHGLAEDPRRADRLPGFSGFSAATHTKWLSEQVTVTAGLARHHDAQREQAAARAPGRDARHDVTAAP